MVYKKYLWIVFTFSIILVCACNSYDINKVSKNYKTHKDIRSLKILAEHVKKGQTKDYILELCGEPNCFSDELSNKLCYLTNERTTFGNSFYVLSILFDSDDKVASFSLNIADE